VRKKSYNNNFSIMKALVGYKLSHILQGITGKIVEVVRPPAGKGGIA
jgi:hypothetical protein